jgi:excisionase family DNA binding protein
MTYSLKQAAEATGKSKPTILRAIQSGKISATRDQLTQAWIIEPSEVHRVYPPVSNDDTQQGTLVDHEIPYETALLRREVAIRDEKLNALQQERNREREEARETIDDLRRRLDAEAEERRKLTALLTDQRAKEEPEPPRRRSWWRIGKR